LKPKYYEMNSSQIYDSKLESYEDSSYNLDFWFQDYNVRTGVDSSKNNSGRGR